MGRPIFAASPVSYLTQLRNDMAQSGWDKTFASLDRTPAQDYAIDDILGLIHANPLIQGRVQNYPPFLALGERSEFTELGADADFQKLLDLRVRRGLHRCQVLRDEARGARPEQCRAESSHLRVREHDIDALAVEDDDAPGPRPS